MKKLQKTPLSDEAREKWTIIATTMRKQLFYYAKQFVKNNEEANDIVSEVFLKALEIDKEYTDSLEAKNYLYKAVHNTCLKWIAKQQQAVEIRNDLPIIAPDIDERYLMMAVEAISLHEFVDHIIEKLEGDNKVLAIKLFKEGKTHKQVAAEMNYTINYLYTKKNRLREKILAISSQLPENLKAVVWLILSLLGTN